ncbi:30S ribosomal protein S10 [Candidatus Azambacteria bacterium]|nr:30S ribosomal protein S10 [Candidatus Azambacteria bacterium]
MSKKEEQVQKLRIKIRAYDNKIIDNSTRQIVEAAERQGGSIAGPVPLPTETRKYAITRSTFVHRSAGDHYEMRVHKRIVDILNPSAKTIDALTNLSLPAGVDIEIKMM